MDRQYTSSSTNTAPANGGAPVGLDLRELVLGIWNRKFMIAGVVIVAMVACVLFLATATQKYTSEARVLIQDRESAFTRATADRAAVAPDSLAVRSEVQVIRSRDLALKVAQKLRLDKVSEFNSASKGPGIKTRILMAIGLKKGPSQRTIKEKILKAYNSKLKVTPVRESRVIAIEFSSVNPERAAAVANAIAQTYVSETQVAKFENTRRAVEWLSRQIEALRQRVSDSETAVEEFRAKTGLFQGATTTLSKQALSELNTQITQAAAARTTAEARGDAIRQLLRRPGQIETAPEVLNSPLIQRLREQRAVLQRRIDDLSITYLPNHPTMKRLVAERNGLDRQVRGEAVKVLRGLEDQAQVAGAREKALRDNLVALKTKAALSNQDEIRLKALEREAGANRRLLEAFLDRFREASAREDVTSLPPSARVISTAQINSSPSFPKTGPILLLALVGSTVLGVVMAFLVEMFSLQPMPASGSSTARSQRPPFEDDIRTDHFDPAPAYQPTVRTTFETRIQPPPIMPASAPAVEPAPPQPQPAYQAIANIPFDSAIQTLRATVAASALRVQSNRVLLTSTGLEQDNAIVGVSLARALATSGVRVLLIDADFHNAGAGRMMGVAATAGLAELLLGSASFKDVVTDDPASGVQVVTAGMALEHGRTQLRSPRMDRVIEALSRAYNYVVIVSPSIVASNDASHFAANSRLAIMMSDVTAGDHGTGAATIQSLLSFGCQEVIPVDSVVTADGLFIQPRNPVTRLGAAA